MGSVEIENFWYAFPALEGCAKVSEDRRLEYLAMIRRGEAPSREEQAATFPDMVRRMEEKVGRDYWTIDGVRRYWWVEHNKIIDNREAGYEFASPEHCETCKVKFWKVRDVLNDGCIAVLESKRGETLNAANYRGLELGGIEYVVTHKNNIATSATRDDFERYG